MGNNPWYTEEMVQDAEGNVTVTRTAKSGNQSIQYFPKGAKRFQWTAAADSVAVPGTEDVRAAWKDTEQAISASVNRMVDDILHGGEEKRTGVLAPAKKKPGYSGPSFMKF